MESWGMTEAHHPDHAHRHPGAADRWKHDGEAIAINLDIEPVEKPETVLWVDPIHRDPAAKIMSRR
jgi:hypothetical protein